jgi:tetratricopeptide (TPR) repeat protein
MRRDLKFSRGLVGKQPSFRQVKEGKGSYHILILLLLIVAGILLISRWQTGSVEPLFQPTPVPTRTADSYILEARSHFAAGRINDPDPTRLDAIEAYQKAIELDPQNAQVQAELARIMTYSSSLLSTIEQRRSQLTQAREYIDRATELAPDDSTVYAIRSFVYDWNANRLISGDNSADYLQEARNAAARALQLDPNNALALAYYAEVLIDQQEWTQAEQYVKQAVELEPSLMDAHRVHGYVMESLGFYNTAIEEYLKAAEINPNLTFLYISIGLNYRSLKVYNRALEFFEKAANINDALGIKDPLPYIEIAKTYAQLGEFFIASRNAEKAMSFDPTNANTYGQMGSIYVQARNYEGALPILQCAVEGCTLNITEDEITSIDGNTTMMNCPVAGCVVPEGESSLVTVEGLPLSSLTVAYYYIRYGSVLAALDLCDQALPVLDQVRQKYPDDTVIGSIIDENYAICGR